MQSQKVTYDFLKSHLWAAADILRGSLDASEFRQPVMTILFLKRLNDTFEENAEKLLNEGKTKKQAYEEPFRHSFFIPKDARWNVLADASKNIGEEIDKVCRLIEKENPRLDGVLTNTKYNDKKKYPDDRLRALISHFNQPRLRNSDLEKEDVFGDAYEYLLEQFADATKKSGGEFFTPREVVKLLVNLVEPKEGMKICDPTCGSGGKLKTYDRVLANFPFSMDWDNKGAEKDPYNRFKFGISPAKDKADFAFIQHMFSSLNEKGQAAIICSQGVLFRGNEEVKIREGMIKEDVIEGIIALPQALFFGTGIPGCVLLLNRNKPEKRKNKIIFIHAAKDLEEIIKTNIRNPQGKIKTVIEQLRQAEEILRGIVSISQAVKDDERFKLKNTIDFAINLMRQRLTRNEITIETNYQTDPTIVGSHRLIAVMLMNLIDNSIFWLNSQKKSNRIIKISLIDYDKNFYAIIVSDNGPGIHDDLDLLTRPFVTRKTKGMGLGLYICDRIATMHDGKLKALNEFDMPGLLSGANITFLIPKSA